MLLKKVHKNESCPSLSKHIIEDSYTETALKYILDIVNAFSEC